jgi:hypothetical protein
MTSFASAIHDVAQTSWHPQPQQPAPVGRVEPIHKGITRRLAPRAGETARGRSTSGGSGTERDQWPIHVEEDQRTVGMLDHHRREPTAR